MKPNQDLNLERILEAAVVLSWGDLTRSTPSRIMHIEYGFSLSGTLDYLQVWSPTTRGYWLLACSYWMSASNLHDSGVHFDNGYQSEGLAHSLEVVMQHQNAFPLLPHFGLRGLLQITAPTETESAAAAASMRDALDCIASALPETLPATA